MKNIDAIRPQLTLSLLTLFLLSQCIQANDVNERSICTSVPGMEELLSKERDLVKVLADYANDLQKKVNIIKSAVRAMRQQNEAAAKDPEKYLANPLNAFSLIRRMYADWENWELFMAKPIGLERVNEMHSLRTNLPTDTDLKEAVEALHRLQVTYDLKAEDMAKGILNGKQYDIKMSSMDCYAMGYVLFKDGIYYDAGFWFYNALNIHKDNEIHEVLGFRATTILEMYAEDLYKQNRYQDAITIIDRLLKKNPNDARLLDKKRNIEMEKIRDNKLPLSMERGNPTVYQRCCRGDFVESTSRLYCVYNRTTTPFLTLAPIKMEIIREDPYMVLFHDVISEAEVAELQRMAKPHLKRATVYSEEQKKSVVVSRRTSKFAWFPDYTNDLTKRLNRRITDMTGFDLAGSEMLQAMNYGLGGHYDTHFDFFNVSMTADIVRMQGDRMATVLFYMTEVEQGGATVFPNIRTAVFPKKGAAIMWYNLDNRMQGDGRTLHAACPVIVGSKWVCNKWIRERNQIRARPCYGS